MRTSYSKEELNGQNMGREVNKVNGQSEVGRKSGYSGGNVGKPQGSNEGRTQVEARRVQDTRNRQVQANESRPKVSENRAVKPQGVENPRKSRGVVYEDDIQEEYVKTKKKKSSVVLLVLLIIVIVGGLGAGGYFVYTKFADQNRYKKLISDIDDLYTDGTKVAIRDDVQLSDLEGMYSTLNELALKDFNTKDLEIELTTIQYYIKDNIELSMYDSEDYSLTTVGLSDALNVIYENTNNYTVEGLANTIRGKVAQLNQDYNDFIQLRIDVQNYDFKKKFDKDEWKERILGVKHKANRLELYEIIEKVTGENLNDEGLEPETSEGNSLEDALEGIAGEADGADIVKNDEKVEKGEK